MKLLHKKFVAPSKWEMHLFALEKEKELRLVHIGKVVPLPFSFLLILKRTCALGRPQSFVDITFCRHQGNNNQNIVYQLLEFQYFFYQFDNA